MLTKANQPANASAGKWILTGRDDLERGGRYETQMKHSSCPNRLSYIHSLIFHVFCSNVSRWLMIFTPSTQQPSTELLQWAENTPLVLEQKLVRNLSLGSFKEILGLALLRLCAFLGFTGEFGRLKGKQCHSMELRATSPNIKVLTYERWPSSQVGLSAESRVTEADRQPPPTGRVQGSSPFPQDAAAFERGLQTLGIAPGAWGQSKQKREKKERDKLPWPWTRS